MQYSHQDRTHDLAAPTLLSARTASLSDSKVMTSILVAQADAGASWTVTSAPSTSWAAIASNSDGQMLVAGALQGSFIYSSSNAGGSCIHNGARTMTVDQPCSSF